MNSVSTNNRIFKQLKALLLVHFKMDFRGHRAFSQRQPRLSPLVWNLIVYTLMSGFLAFRLFGNGHPSHNAFLLFSYGMLMTFFAVLMETGHTLVNPEDSEILAFQPIQTHVYFIAKLLNMVFYVLLITLALGVIPSLTGSFRFGAGFGIIAFGLLFLANLWTTAFVIFIYAGLIKVLPYQRFKDILAFVQMGFAFILFFLYNLVPRMGWESMMQIHFTQYNWIKIVPSAWFAGLFNVLFRTASSFDWFQSFFAIGSFVLLLQVTFRRLSFSFSQKLFLLQHVTEQSRPQTIKKFPFRFSLETTIERIFLRSKEALIGFRMASLFLKRDRVVKLSVYSMLGFPLAFLLIALFIQTFPNLFSSDFLEEGSTLIHGSIVFIFLMIFSIFQGMTFSLNWDASWIYSVTPLYSPGRLFQGIQLLILVRLIIPFFMIYGLIYLFAVSSSHGLIFTLQLFLLSILGLTIAPLFINDYPFSRNRQKGEGMRSFLMVIFILPFWGMAILLHKVTEFFSWGFWAEMIILLGTAGIFEYLSLRRLDRVLAQKEYYH